MKLSKFPTLCYFPPFYRKQPNHLGIKVKHLSSTIGEPHLFELLANSSTIAHSWPNLPPIESTSTSELFASLPNYVQYVFLVYDDPMNDSFAAQKVALDFHKIKQVQIRRVGSQAITKHLGLDVQSAVYVGNNTIKNIEFLKQLANMSRDSVRSAVGNYLTSEGVDLSHVNQQTSSTPPSADQTTELSRRDTEIIGYVKLNPGMVFQSESAIRHSIAIELVKYNEMNDEQMSALKEYISVLNKYGEIFRSKFLSRILYFICQRTISEGVEKKKNYTQKNLCR